MNAIPLRVLLVEDCEDDALLLLRELRRGGYQPVHRRVETPEALQEAIGEGDFDAALIDFTMPGFDGITALTMLRGCDLDVPLIILSGTIGEEVAVDAMRRGAHDYIMKSNMARLLPALERELREARVREERRRVVSMARRQANHDPVTQLPNRQLFHDRLRQSVWGASLHNASVGLALIDLDHFAEINESIGHAGGDLVLAEVAERLRVILPEPATVARLGNDEFAVIEPASTAAVTEERARLLLDAIRRPIALPGGSVSVDACVGIASFPAHADEADALLQRAGIALRAAKAARVETKVFDSSLERDAMSSLALASDLRRALDEDPAQLFVVFQPKIRLATGAEEGAEALIRWEHPRLGILLPDQFVPLAEESGLIRKATALVVARVTAAMAAMRAGGARGRIAVNLSMADLEDPSFPAELRAAADVCDIGLDTIEIEITEGAMMRSPLSVLRSLEELRSLGVATTVDDFGIGHSSFAYLKDLPVTGIKIDKCFVAEMAKDGTSAAIVRSIIDLGHNLGLEVIAEGVEEAAAAEQLAEMGCDLAQGFHFAHPMEAADLADWRSRRAG